MEICLYDASARQHKSLSVLCLSPVYTNQLNWLASIFSRNLCSGPYLASLNLPSATFSPSFSCKLQVCLFYWYLSQHTHTVLAVFLDYTSSTLTHITITHYIPISIPILFSHAVAYQLSIQFDAQKCYQGRCLLLALSIYIVLYKYRCSTVKYNTPVYLYLYNHPSI